MFPGPGAQVYYNEAGEPLGWDYPSEPEPHDGPDYDHLDSEFECQCGEVVWGDDEDGIVAHYEVCPCPDWFAARFPDQLAEVLKAEGVDMETQRVVGWSA